MFMLSSISLRAETLPCPTPDHSKLVRFTNPPFSRFVSIIALGRASARPNLPSLLLFIGHRIQGGSLPRNLGWDGVRKALDEDGSGTSQPRVTELMSKGRSRPGWTASSTIRRAKEPASERATADRDDLIVTECPPPRRRH